MPGWKRVLTGGTGREQVTALALDKSGDLFVTGFSTSNDFPVKNALQPHLAGPGDAFLAKIPNSPAGKLLFATYLGGAKLDAAYGLALDSSGNPIVSRNQPESPDFPSTPSAFHPHLNGSVDAFVTKFSADGSRILWSTYYGGSKANSDQFLGGSLATDQAGRVWFTGMTNSLDLPRRNPSQAVYGGGDFDGFLAALSSDGARLCYGSYLGGNGHDTLEGLTVRGSRIYAAGITSSTGLHQKHSQIQGGYGGGPYDTIVIGLDSPADRSCRWRSPRGLTKDRLRNARRSSCRCMLNWRRGRE